MADDPNAAVLDLDDIQSGVLRPRPSPYAATYILLRIDAPRDGRELVRRLSQVVTSAAAPDRPGRDTWVSVALTFEGLQALGVPQASLDSFAWEFRQGMTARASALGDVGPSAPAHWEAPFGGPGVHLILVGVAPDHSTGITSIGGERSPSPCEPSNWPVRARSNSTPSVAI